jgi:hypothetical protein
MIFSTLTKAQWIMIFSTLTKTQQL